MADARQHHQNRIDRTSSQDFPYLAPIAAIRASRSHRSMAGSVRGKSACTRSVSRMPSGHEPSPHLPLLQDQSRDHPPSGDDVCPIPTVIAERRGPAARTWHRQIAPPSSGSGFVQSHSTSSRLPWFYPAAVAQLLEVVLVPNGLLNFADERCQQAVGGVEMTRRSFGRDACYPFVNYSHDGARGPYVPQAIGPAAQGAARLDVVDF